MARAARNVKRSSPRQAKNKNPFNVKLGQVWVSLDPRRQVRLRITRVDLKHGIAETESIGSKRAGRVALSRFRGNVTKGYALVPFPQPVPQAAEPTAATCPPLEPGRTPVSSSDAPAEPARESEPEGTGTLADPVEPAEPVAAADSEDETADESSEE